jgi:short-subunit dehydrogenase
MAINTKKISIVNPLALIAAGAGLMILSRRILQPRLHLNGLVVLITGGSRGLGLALAEEFARHGTRLVICARDKQELERAQTILTEVGAEVMAIPCDLTNRIQVQSMLEQATKRFGSIDILVNNAGIISAGPLDTLTVEDFEMSMDNIYWAMLHTTLALLPQMISRKQGRIVNISSIGGLVSVPHLLTYASAKFAVQGFSEGLRAELAKEGIKVTTVAPGLIRTGSQINTIMKGSKYHQEYTLFTLMDTLPVTSISARRAARQIVKAVEYGSAGLVITTQAKILARFHGLFPGLTSDILGFINRFLPTGNGADTSAHLGSQSETAITQSLLTVLGRLSSRIYNENGH